MALKKINSQEFTVSDSVLSPADATSKVTNEVLMAYFWLKSGGKIHHNVSSDPTAGGAAGDFGQVLDDKWAIWGHDNVLGFRMIKQTGESDGVVEAQYWGTGKT